MKNRAREACGRASLQFTDDESTVAHSAGSALIFQRSWGSAPLHPRLYAIATLRGLSTKTPADLIRASFSLSFVR